MVINLYRGYYPVMLGIISEAIINWSLSQYNDLPRSNLQGTVRPYPSKRESRKIIDSKVPCLVEEMWSLPRGYFAEIFDICRDTVDGCWWKKSCTSWYGKYPLIYMVLAPFQMVVWDFWTINSMVFPNVNTYGFPPYSVRSRIAVVVVGSGCWKGRCSTKDQRQEVDLRQVRCWSGWETEQEGGGSLHEGNHQLRFAFCNLRPDSSVFAKRFWWLVLEWFGI